MRYAGIIYNDFSAAPGVSLTFFAQGCAHHCAHCHNQETWDFDKGLEFTEDIPDKIVEGLTSLVVSLFQSKKKPAEKTTEVVKRKEGK